MIRRVVVDPSSWESFVKHARASSRRRPRWIRLAVAAVLAVCAIPATPAFTISEPAELRLASAAGADGATAADARSPGADQDGTGSDATQQPGPGAVAPGGAAASGAAAGGAAASGAAAGGAGAGGAGASEGTTAGPAAGAAGGSAPAGAAPAATGTGVWRAVSSRSGLPWASGAWGENEPSGVREWAAWRGRPVDVATWWVDRSSWGGMTDFSAIADAGFDTYSVGIPPFPEDSGGSLKACAAGDYDRHWADIGRAISAAGLQNKIVVRLGWEFDGDWYEWSARDPAAFAQCWRQAVSAAESVAPGIRWAWNVSRGPNHIPADSTRAYPGDQYVDTIGVDSSDFYPPATDERSWNEHLNGEFGLNYWLGFARRHHKSLSIPEWGGVSGTQEEAGHDNPFYIRKMHGFFAQNAEWIGYESYFDTTEGYWRSELMNSGSDLPRASATYRQLWGAGKAGSSS